MLKRISFILLFILILIHVEAQNLMIISSTVGNDLTVCINETDYQIDIQNPSPFDITQASITIKLPTGVQYVPNTVNNGVEQFINRNDSLVFTIQFLFNLKIELLLFNGIYIFAFN